MCFLHLDLIRETYRKEHSREIEIRLKGRIFLIIAIDFSNTGNSFHLNSITYFHNVPHPRSNIKDISVPFLASRHLKKKKKRIHHRTPAASFLFCCLSISVLVVVLFTVHCKMDSSPIVTTHTNNKSKSSRKSFVSQNNLRPKFSRPKGGKKKKRRTCPYYILKT